MAVHITSLSVDDVTKKLSDKGLTEAADKFKANGISGQMLNCITEKKLQEMGIKAPDQIQQVWNFIRGLTDQFWIKIFNDPVNGHIEVHPLCVKIIDTPQFQRLRDIKQTGGCYFVYPGASHNRFEHSIGVSHIAGQLTRTLQTRQPELNITNEDVLCVEIAGLCHDLGHGPFSHLFDAKFIPTVRKDSPWKHEKGSVVMFQHLIHENKLMNEFEKYSLDSQDIEFIKEQIAGPSTSKAEKNGENHLQYSGREKSKSFLYEIVANQKNGIDVDKWDYFARDCHGLGIKNTFDHHRLMKFARVLKVDGELQICSRDKEAETLYNMFHVRAILHRRAYKHRVCNAVEAMITDALICADKVKLVPGKDGDLKRLSECIDDCVAFTNLTDSIYHVILMTKDKDLEESKQILQRIERRQLYVCVAETNPIEAAVEENNADIHKLIVSQIPEKSSITEDDLYVDLVKIDYGKKNKNPMDDARFYSKRDITKSIKIEKSQISRMLSNVFAEKYIRLYCKKTDKESLKTARKCFQEYCEIKGYFLQPMISDVDEKGYTKTNI